MKFVVRSEILRLGRYSTGSGVVHIEFDEFDSIEEAEKYISLNLGKRTEGHYTERLIQRMVVYPLRDGVEYSTKLVKTYNFSEESS